MHPAVFLVEWDSEYLNMKPEDEDYYCTKYNIRKIIFWFKETPLLDVKSHYQKNVKPLYCSWVLTGCWHKSHCKCKTSYDKIKASQMSRLETVPLKRGMGEPYRAGNTQKVTSQFFSIWDLLFAFIWHFILDRDFNALSRGVVMSHFLCVTQDNALVQVPQAKLSAIFLSGLWLTAL